MRAQVEGGGGRHTQMADACCEPRTRLEVVSEHTLGGACDKAHSQCDGSSQGLDRGPLARLNPGSQSERGEAPDKIDDIGRWPQAAAAGARLSPAASPRPSHAVQCSAAPLPASLMPAVGSCLEDGTVGVHGRTRNRLLPATLSQGPTTERALMAPCSTSNGAASGVSQQTSATRPGRAAAEGRGGAAEPEAPPEPPKNLVEVRPVGEISVMDRARDNTRSAELGREFFLTEYPGSIPG